MVEGGWPSLNQSGELYCISELQNSYYSLFIHACKHIRKKETLMWIFSLFIFVAVYHVSGFACLNAVIYRWHAWHFSLPLTVSSSRPFTLSFKWCCSSTQERKPVSFVLLRVGLYQLGGDCTCFTVCLPESTISVCLHWMCSRNGPTLTTTKESHMAQGKQSDQLMLCN